MRRERRPAGPPARPPARPPHPPFSTSRAVWLFLVYTFTACSWGLALIGAHFFACSASPSAACRASSPGSALGIVAVAVLASLFTGCLAVDQSNIAFTGRTQIDRMKSGDDDGGDGGGGGARDEARLRLWHNLSEVCGGDAARDGPRLAWLLPTRIVYPDPERLTGYCFREIVRVKRDVQLEELEMV